MTLVLKCYAVFPTFSSCQAKRVDGLPVHQTVIAFAACLFCLLVLLARLPYSVGHEGWSVSPPQPADCDQRWCKAPFPVLLWEPATLARPTPGDLVATVNPQAAGTTCKARQPDTTLDCMHADASSGSQRMLDLPRTALPLKTVLYLYCTLLTTCKS
jgi:hypothetical protein